MSTPTASPSGRRRRSSSRGKGGDLFAFVNSRQMNWLMLAVAVIFLALVAFQIRTRMSWYTELALADDPAAVVYALGQPTARASNGSTETWNYRQSARVISVALTDGRVTRIACASHDVPACPDLWGIDDRSQEAEVLTAFGHPDRIGYAGEDKVLFYDALGLNLRLHRRRVQAIEVSSQRAGVFDTFARYLRVMIP